MDERAEDFNVELAVRLLIERVGELERSLAALRREVPLAYPEQPSPMWASSAGRQL